MSTSRDCNRGEQNARAIELFSIGSVRDGKEGRAHGSSLGDRSEAKLPRLAAMTNAADSGSKMGIKEMENWSLTTFPLDTQIREQRDVEEGKKGKEEEGKGRLALIREGEQKPKGEHCSSSTCSSATASVTASCAGFSRRQTISVTVTI